MNEASIVAGSSEAPYRLRVVFRRFEDRYAHSILLSGTGDETELLTSLEGDPHSTWPPSPPLQQLHIQDLADQGPAALLVGMAGRNHWSMSVAADPSRAELRFDVACRATKLPRCLTSSYRSTAPPLMSAASDVQFRCESATCRVTTEMVDDDATSTVSADGDCLAVRCEVDARPLPATFRWVYRVTLIEKGC